MNYNTMARLAARTGMTAILESLGLKDAVWRRLNPDERNRNVLLASDLELTKKEMAPIVSGLPRVPGTQALWVISSISEPWSYKLEGAISLAVRLKRFHPIAVHPNSDVWGPRYHRAFGVDEFIGLRRYKERVDNVVTPKEISDFVEGGPTIKDLLSFSMRNVGIGRIALSNLITRNKFQKFDLSRPELKRDLSSELKESYLNTLAAEAMVDEHRPKTAILMEKGLSPTAEIFGVLISKGIPVVQYVGSQNTNDFVLKRYVGKNLYQHPFSLDTKTWDRVKQMEWTAEMDGQLMSEFEESYRSGTWFNRKFLHEGKQIKSPEAVRQQLGLQPGKRTAVIFSHVLWDATFFFGDSLFPDYETWLIESVRAACNNDRVNWIVKLHPDLVWKLKFEKYDGELRDLAALRSALGSLPDHVKLVLPETDISSYSFFDITDYCVTVRGTIGIEMACHGVPVIVAGTGRYSGLGFTTEPASTNEFMDRLASIETLPPMSQEQIRLARRFAYTLFKMRPWPLRSFEMVSLPMDKIGSPIERNLIARIKTFDELSAAPDMVRIAEWLDSDSLDYLHNF